MARLYDFFMVGMPREAEENVLYLKLIEEYPHVDGFYIIESDCTLQNQKKPYYYEDVFKQPHFACMRDKIHYHQISAKHLGFIDVTQQRDNEGFHNENAQRSYLFQQLKHKFSPEDLIFISDSDEVLDGKNINKLRNIFHTYKHIHTLKVPMLRAMYDYNNIEADRGLWVMPHLLKASAIDTQFSGSFHAIRIDTKAPIATRFAKPSRYRFKPNNFANYYLKKLLYKFYNTLFTHQENKKSASLKHPLCETDSLGYFGWHFSSAFKEPVFHFYKVWTAAHSKINQTQFFPYYLRCMQENRVLSMPGDELKPQCQIWPLSEALFPHSLLERQATLLTHFREKVQDLNLETIMALYRQHQAQQDLSAHHGHLPLNKAKPAGKRFA